MSNKKNPADQAEIDSKLANPLALDEFKDFQEEQISFPPYWDVGDNKWFYGMVVAVDDRDAEFVRYVVQAERPIMCKQGSKKKKESEDVEVKPGEFFTLSAYSGLPLDRYIGVKVLVRVTGKKDVGQPQPMWTFSLHVSPEDKKMLLSERKTRALEAARRFRNRDTKQLGEGHTDDPPFS